MNILFYTILFIIGIVVGGFWALEATEIPKSNDMRKIHYSKYCHDELISKMTYLLVGGLTSVVLANVLGIRLGEIDLLKTIIYVFSMLYITTLVLIGGIDRIYIKIVKKIISFGIICSIIYMIYLSAIDLASFRLSAIYLTIYMILLIVDTLLLRKYAKDSYIVNILILLTIILAFTDLRTLTYTVVMAFIAINIYMLIEHNKKKNDGNKKLKITEVPVAYFISVSNIIVLFMIRIFENYLILA